MRSESASDFRRYARWVLLGTLGLASLVACFNVTVDAHGVFGSPIPESWFGFRRDYESRSARAERLHRGDWNAVVVGSSRVHVGIDTRDPVFGGRPVLNLGLPNTSACELREVVSHALASNDLHTVYLFVELELFGTPCKLPPSFLDSKFNPRIDVVDYYLENAIGYAATRSTLETLRMTDSVGTDDHGVLHVVRPADDLLAVARRVLLSRDKTLARFSFDPEAMDSLESAAEGVVSSGADLYVVYSPVHASLLELQHRHALEASADRVTRELATRLDELTHRFPERRIEFWDFSGHRGDALSPLPTEGGSWEEFRDPSHFRPNLGRRIIGALAREGRDPEDESLRLGTRIELGSLEAHLSARRLEGESYRRTHRREIARLDAILEE